LIFVVTGLVALRRAAHTAALRKRLGWLIGIVMFLMWESVFRYQLVYHGYVHGIPVAFYGFWIVRELLWWYLVGVLLALLGIFAVQSEPFAVAGEWSARWLRAHPRSASD
jgi:hypothetical protein